MLVHPHPFRVTPGQERRPRGSTDGGRNHEAGKFAALAGQPVDIGSLDPGGTKTAQITVALIVSEDDDEIRLFSHSNLTKRNQQADYVKKRPAKRTHENLAFMFREWRI